MPVLLTNQRAFQQVSRRMTFCYLCGEPLSGECNRDHVPPTAIFLEPDRDNPLILPTHSACNHSRTKDDEVVGQLIGIIHGNAPKPKARKLKLGVRTRRGQAPDVMVSGFDLRAIIRRWVRGFHAALYDEFLPDDSGLFVTIPPLAEGEESPDKGITPIAPPEVFAPFVTEIKKNRATQTLDRIVCRNGKCVYECVWTQADRGQWFCVYALDLYGWIELGDTEKYGERGCVGGYRRVGGGVPQGATEATRLVFDVANARKGNPFAD
jgi:hypothetical protein